MKALYFSFIFLCAHLIIAQEIKVTLDYSDLNTRTTVKQGELLKQSDLRGEPAKDFIIEFTNVNDATEMDKFKFFEGNTEKDKIRDLSGTYLTVDKKYRITLTTLLLNLSSSTTIIIKRDNKEVYKFDVQAEQIAPPATATCDKQDFQSSIKDEFDNRILTRYKTNLQIKDRDNLYIDNNNTLHLFIDHYGQYHGYAPPTTATEKYTYQVHLITSECLEDEYLYLFDYKGNYAPSFNIDKGASAQSAGAMKFTVIDFPIIGPFTEEFTFTIKTALKTNLNKTQQIARAEISVPKLYHVSITAGLIATTLRNPSNIEISSLNATENTLIADDPSVRGLITLMAVYYPKGRSFLHPPEGNLFDPSRFGVIVGTQFGKDANENLLGGFSFDFARGGAVILGAHFGRRNVIPGHRNFDFGDEIFEENTLPTIKKEWNVGFFFGVSIDARVAAELLKTIFTAP